MLSSVYWAAKINIFIDIKGKTKIMPYFCEILIH